VGVGGGWRRLLEHSSRAERRGIGSEDATPARNVFGHTAWRVLKVAGNEPQRLPPGGPLRSAGPPSGATVVRRTLNSRFQAAQKNLSEFEYRFRYSSWNPEIWILAGPDRLGPPKVDASCFSARASEDFLGSQGGIRHRAEFSSYSWLVSNLRQPQSTVVPPLPRMKEIAVGPANV
jgi:hypothetical protein